MGSGTACLPQRSSNKLTLLQPGVFEGLGELQALDLSDNELVSLPTSWLVDNA